MNLLLANARAIVGILILSIFWACTHTHPVTNETRPELSKKINSGTLRRAASITLKEDQSLKGYRVEILHDSTAYWVESKPNEWAQYKIANGEIERITLKRHAKGAGQGLGLGVLIGAPVGTLVLGGQLGGGENLDTQEFLEALVLASAGGGAVIGLLVGSAIGSKDIFVIDDLEQRLER